MLKIYFRQELAKVKNNLFIRRVIKFIVLIKFSASKSFYSWYTQDFSQTANDVSNLHDNKNIKNNFRFILFTRFEDFYWFI